MQPLPQQFVVNMRHQLGDSSAEALFEALESSSPISVRLNPYKWHGGEYGTAVPWCEWGRYLDTRPQFTTEIPFVAGAYYVQEAGSQFIAHILKTEGIEGGKIIDMCAAPGGKTTLYSAIVGDRGLVLANEYVRNRANVLADNVRKWGLGNVVVTNNDPQHIAAFEQWADVVAVDAPCSGEGMFRKDEVARSEWTAQSVDMCAARQMDILRQAWKSLKAGGLLIYSTCTFNTTEDEGILEQMTSEWGEEIEPSTEIAVLDDWGVECIKVGDFQGFRFFPHRVKSEGFFVAVARKRADVGGRSVVPKPRKKIMTDAPREAIKELSRWVVNPDTLRFAVVAESYYAYPLEYFETIRSLANNLTVIYSGVEMGQIFKGKLKPEWSLSQSVWYNRDVVPSVELGREEALDYLRKKDVSAGVFVEGINLVSSDGYALGFVKRVGNRVNNGYPNSLKINNL
ncbi:MAG: rRNA cytosine-C5-methylase [Alistipes sp.]|nr:rRNA cytosine-C5-methylase [Alistipes sp.]